MKNNRIFWSVVLLWTCIASSNVSALTAWNGTATYPTTPTATTTGIFNTYDFGVGIALVENDERNGTFKGYYQTIVDGHFLSSIGVNVPGLTISGSGSGFELTLAAEFFGNTSLSNNNLDFTVTGGSASLYFDDTPDYSFAIDSGFTDGLKILSGTITSGVGSILFPGILGVGVEQLELDFSDGINSFDSDVFETDTIAGGSALFSIKTKTAANLTPVIDEVIAGANSVMGHSAVGFELLQADGSLEINAVPVPSGVWLLTSALLVLVATGNRRKAIAHQSYNNHFV